MTFEKDEQGNVIAHLTESIDERAFLAWKEHIINQRNNNNFTTEAEISSFPLAAREELADKPTENNIIIRQCLQEVKQLNIASMTPMEALLYLNNLQKKLKDINL